jgi:D-3-phosphoglycerate dehydrogenase / 2-oxoglutarate reductase
VQLDDHVSMFRYHDRPGMLGRVGTLLGANNVNIASSVVGRQPEGAAEESFAAMIVSTDSAVPDALIREIATSDGFVTGVTVTL